MEECGGEKCERIRIKVKKWNKKMKKRKEE